jgi:hypothetical protein
MTSKEKILYKSSLKQFALDKINQRAMQAMNAVRNAQDAANSEEKSSAGDKYETGRAMAHLETDLHNKLLSDIRKEMNQLQLLDISHINDRVIPGSFVRCDEISFFFSAGLGKQVIGGTTVIFVSPQAPVLKELLHKKATDTFIFQGRKMIIHEVF